MKMVYGNINFKSVTMNVQSTIYEKLKDILVRLFYEAMSRLVSNFRESGGIAKKPLVGQQKIFIYLTVAQF